VSERDIVVYTAPGVELSLPLDSEHETVWATQAQIADLFGIDRTGATRHINNVLRGAEVDRESNVQKVHIPSADRPVALYSLDVILAVGYRTNSARAIEFRRWASCILKQYMLAGVALNKRRLLELGQVVQILSRSTDELVAGVADVLAEYLPGLTLLRDYDDGHIAMVSGTVPGWELTIAEARAVIAGLTGEFPEDELLGRERGEALEGIVGGHIPELRRARSLSGCRGEGGEPAVPRGEGPSAGGRKQAKRRGSLRYFPGAQRTPLRPGWPAARLKQRTGGADAHGRDE